MKGYQVFKGGTDKHDRQFYELLATYLSKQKALEHAETIAKENANGQELEVISHPCHYTNWNVYDQWIPITVAKMEEIDIIETI